MNPQPKPDVLDQFGPLLTLAQLAQALGKTLHACYKIERQGGFEDFKVHQPQFPPHVYSKQLIARYLAGEDIHQPARIFGRKRA